MKGEKGDRRLMNENSPVVIDVIDARRGKDWDSPGRNGLSDRDIIIDEPGRILIKETLNQIRCDRKSGPGRKWSPSMVSNNSTVHTRSREDLAELEIARKVDKGGEIRSKDIGILREAGPKESERPHLFLVDMLETFATANSNRVSE
jgi:hypothetical protein